MIQDKKTQRPPKTWTDYCQLRWTGQDKPTSRMGKIRFEQFLKENNIPRLKILKTFSSASEISFNNLPDYFVLKPANLWSSKGVMLLHKISGLDLYFDAKQNSYSTKEKIIQAQYNLEKELKKNLTYIIEERALDEDPEVIIPFDYKIFTFYGQTKFIVQIDRNHSVPKLAFFDGNFNSIKDNSVYLPKYSQNNLGIPRVPKHKSELLNLAKDISIKLKAPFISIDCYSTSQGAFLGELTHTPGGPWYGSMYRFSDEFDLMLGNAWTEANQRLGIKPKKINIPYEIKLKNKVYRINK